MCTPLARGSETACDVTIKGEAGVSVRCWKEHLQCVSDRGGDSDREQSDPGVEGTSLSGSSAVG